MNRSLLAIITAFAVVIACFSVKICSSSYINAIEALVYLDLIVLSAAKSNDVNSPALVNFLLAIVFAVTMGIILYQFHALFIAKSKVWQKILAILKGGGEIHATSEAAPLLAPVANTTPPPTVVTSSIVSIKK